MAPYNYFDVSVEQHLVCLIGIYTHPFVRWENETGVDLKVCVAFPETSPSQDVP